MSFYFKQYIYNMIYDTENAYNLLEDEYREKRFGGYDAFADYIKDNAEDIRESLIIKYKIEEFEEYKEYLCIDNFNNLYIFLEKEPMDYSVLLDEYTIGDKIINNQYKQDNKKSKVQMNLDKFMHMLNRKDYQAAYNVLDEGFKEKYFNNLSDFTSYVSKTFFNYNEFTYTDNIKESEEEFKIKTEISNIKENTQDTIIKRFKVKLTDDNSFYLSFDI